MPGQPTPRLVAVEDQLAKRIDDTLDPLAKALAERLGPAPGSDRYSAREIADLWDTKDQSVDTDALYQALQQGLPAEDVPKVALFRMAPELAKLVTATPVPPAQAAAIAKLAEYPGRYVLTASHSSDAATQVSYVEDMHKQAAKRQAPAPADTTSQPVMPPPPPAGGY